MATIYVDKDGVEHNVTTVKIPSRLYERARKREINFSRLLTAALKVELDRRDERYGSCS